MDALTHVLVPSLVLLAVRVPARRVALVAPLMVLPDLDVLVGLHRASLHNVFAIALAAGFAYLIARSRNRADAGTWAGLAAFALGSHVLLDLPTAVAALWPLTPVAPFVSVQVFWDSLAHAVVPVVEAGVLAGAPQAGSPGAPVTGATLTFVRAVSAWAVVTAGVLLPVAWAAFHPDAARGRARLARRVRAPTDDEVAAQW